MVVKEKILSVMLEQYPAWADSPEDFLGFITLTAELSRADAVISGKKDFDLPEFVDQLADVFIRVLRVNIGPYRNFQEIREVCRPLSKEDVCHKIEAIVEQMKEDDGLYDLTEGTGVTPGRETMTGDLADDFRCRAVIDNLRPYLILV